MQTGGRSLAGQLFLRRASCSNRGSPWGGLGRTKGPFAQRSAIDLGEIGAVMTSVVTGVWREGGVPQKSGGFPRFPVLSMPNGHPIPCHGG